jgi:tRNA threonylcarbamoyladenosine biosynthesis protein TsaE
MRVEIMSESPEQTRALGAALGRRLRPGDVVLLHGDLGAGKTTLTQGIAEGLGIAGYVQSPTFTLVAEHPGRTASGDPIFLYHLDLYRLSGAAELESFGYEQFLAPVDGITVIEWPERAEGWLPDAYLLVQIEIAGPERRRITIEAIPGEGRLADIVRDLAAARATL